MTRKCTPIDIYFHMTNHYRKLQSVKSVVDTTPPIGYGKLQGTRQSRPPSRTQQKRDSSACNRAEDRHKVTKHDCVHQEDNLPCRSQSLPPRPPTRRKPSDMPTRKKLSPRAQSSGPGSRKNSAQKSRSVRSQHSSKSNPPVFAYFSASNQPQCSRENPEKIPTPAPRNAKPKHRDISYHNSISDHEYLQFSLRITEDIIRNDLYTNTEMRRVFNSHLEANRGRLDMHKMRQQIDNLCKELNVPLNDSKDDDDTARAQMKAKNDKSSCICTPRSTNVNLTDCECGSARCLPFECFQHSLKRLINTKAYINTSDNYYDGNKSIDEDEEVESSQIDIYTNPDTCPVTPMCLSTNIVNPDEILNKIPYYNEEFDMTPIVRQSLGYLELPLLPSLSRVTEQTEPTTSSETLTAKLQNLDQNIESTSEFDSSDVLPVLEEDRAKDYDAVSFTDSRQSKKSTPFGDNEIVKMHSNLELETQPDAGNLSKPSTTAKLGDVNSTVVEGTTSSVSPCNKSEESTKQKGDDNLNSERIISSTSVKSLGPITSQPEFQIKTVCSAPPIYSSQSTSVTAKTTKSEPIPQLIKTPIPAPRTYVGATVESGVKNCQSKVGCNCEMKKPIPQIVLSPENTKTCKPYKGDEEYILVSGPIYVPKSSIIPMETVTPQPTLGETFKTKQMRSFSKDAMVNTDDQVSIYSNVSTNPRHSSAESSSSNYKEPSIGSCSLSINQSQRDSQSDCLSYSMIHGRVINVKHDISLISNISKLSNMPPTIKTAPLSESMFMSDHVQRRMSQPRKLPKHFRETPSYLGQTNAFIHSNDYDLTPQRDSNKSMYSKPGSGIPIVTSQPFDFHDKFTVFNKDALLLGDEYEIKNDFGSTKSSISSCYDNGLPHTICRFYPNSSTQTTSADFLLPPTKLLQPVNSNYEKQGSKHSLTDSTHKELGPDYHKTSILRKKVNLETDSVDNAVHTEAALEEELQQEEQGLFDIELYHQGEPHGLYKSVSFSITTKQNSESLSDILQIPDEADIFYQNEHTASDHNSDADFITLGIENDIPNIVDVVNADTETKEDETEKEIEKKIEDGEDTSSGPSVKLTFQQVTNELETRRNIEAPAPELGEKRYNILPTQNRTGSLVDEMFVKALSKKSSENVASALSAYMERAAKLPIIEVKESEQKLNLRKENSNEFDTVSCFGIKKIKRARRDIIKLDTSATHIPNISTIPDDQLFDMTQAASMDENGNERKSLRFDYSAVQDFNEDPNDPQSSSLEIKDFTSAYDERENIGNASIEDEEEFESDPEPAETPVRPTLVSYRTASKSTSLSSKNDSIVDILLPPEQNSASSLIASIRDNNLVNEDSNSDKIRNKSK